VLAAQTVRFSAIYSDDPTLWREAYRACPTCTKAAINHGMQLAKQGRLDEAEAVLTPMLKPIRGYEAAYVAMAAVQADRGRLEDAAVMARTALTIAPEDRRVRAMARRLGLDLDEPPESGP
jgi:Tfp pilus assembly protein PilF